MNIGIVCYPTFGGSGVVATELGLSLARKGHKVHFITYKRPVRLQSFYQNIYYHEVSSMSYPLFEYEPYETALASKLVEVVRYEKLDLLHVHYAIPHAAVAFMVKSVLAAEGLKIPVVTTLHGTDITLVGNDRTYASVVKFSINSSDGVTAVSEYLKKKTVDTFGIEREIKVIYNFIDFDRFKKVDKDHFKKMLAPNGEKILVHTSNFRKVKRVQDVIKVFEKVSKKSPALLLLIGDGPERPRMEEMCREYGLCDNIRFLGKQNAVEELLAISDVFILPSADESFGLAALEAMACEVPVISTNIGGLPEVNIRNKTGLLSNVGDVESMANNTLELLLNDAKLSEFKKNALEQANLFSINAIVPQYERFYEETIEKVLSGIAIN